ncbi:MAG: penicillin-binding protein [Verrucomicrobiales bacterium]|nr:penicillin-binding protein [Verrucomicrobiales bacterium]
MDRGGKLLHVTLANDGRYRLWTPLADLPPDLAAATLAHEDQRFRSHRGVDPRSIGRAVWGVVSGRRLGGGSTISMQLARLRFGLETRTWSGKAVQMFRALQLERHYSKDQLLEAYLNLVPCGGNVEGSGTASWVWLGKPPSALTFRECVALSLVPQRPARRSPARPDADPTAGPLQSAVIQALRGRSEPQDAGFHLTAVSRPPRTAPHFTREVLRRGTGPVVSTSLDAACQETVERTLRDFLRHAAQEGVRNASALLVHAPTREVRAWVGSADFFDADIQGQVDGVRARRSPGSVLKPFIYGLAIRQGLILPQTLVTDAPAVFRDYNPENYDRGFAGPIPAAEALYRSRNLPAIQLLSQLRKPDFYSFLKLGGVSLPHPAGHYGLALALGAEEVSVKEVATLYAMLADDGLPRPLQWTLAQSSTAPVHPVHPVHSVHPPAPPAETSPFSPGVRFLVRSMLHPRQPAPTDEAWTAGFPGVSWKTGTSHGWRDAWAAAIHGEYVLVVWAGDFKGKPNPALTGRRTAAPLLFSILGALRLPCPPDESPPDLRRAEFCAASGDPPGPHCLQRTSGWCLPGISPVRACTLHQEILIDTATGLRVPTDDGRPGLRHETAEIWPPHLLELFRRAGVPRVQPPPFETAAATAAAGGGRGGNRSPRIVSPVAGRTYTLRSGDAGRRTIPLQAEAAPGVTKLFWFSAREFLGSTDPATPWLWHAVPGSPQIRVIDDQGLSASCPVRVELVP